MLRLNGFNLQLSGVQSCGLTIRNHHIVDSNRHTRLGRHGEPGVHQLIAENHRILKADPAISLIDRRRDRSLFHCLIDEFKRQAVRENLRQ